ncbi:MAG TPA: tetratricopeptide repeat protein [Acidobacteriaceae bacterium]|jgi:tetratricopeptide (TPR) repeat protein|nr:tetratricopeptide repeat protein [Acidobacteriaceae bacterium]
MMILRAPLMRPFRLISVAGVLLASPVLLVAQSPKPAATPSASSPSEPDRSAAYYHYGLAHLYEEMAVSAGRPDYATQAVEEYKLALNADPNSSVLQDGLAELYFRIGRIQEAISTAKDQIKRNPNDVQAHQLLGQVYVRSLGDMHGQQSSQVLQLAIAEYETISKLKPNDVEPKLLLGQLYALNQDSAKAEAEFKAAQNLDANSEEVVLNMARLYSEEGDANRAAQTIASIPVEDRSARMELALGASYEQLKKYKDAAAAYRRAADVEPDNTDAQKALSAALLQDGQLDEALKVLNAIIAADPTDAQTQIRIAEVQRRKGNYNDSLATLEKLKPSVTDGSPEDLQLHADEALVYDALGKYDQATSTLTKLLDTLSHPDGKYNDQEKQSRAFLLDRLGMIYREQNKTTEALNAYKQLVDLGGDYTRDGYQGQIDTYRDMHQWKEAEQAAATAAKALPKDHDIQIVYAQQLTDLGQIEQGLGIAKAQLTNTPDDLDIHQRLAEMYIRLKRYKEADDEIQKADALVKKSQDRLFVYFLRGEFFDRQKMYDKAEEQFRKALEIDPQNAAVLNYLGYMLIDHDQKVPEALKMIRQAVLLEPQNYAYLDSLGWAYFKTGQYELAEENIRKANERNNGDPTIHDHLGEVYEKTGKLKMAVAQWERSMSEYASSLPADADPEEVQKVQHKLESARVKLARLNSSAEKVTK